MTTCMLYLYQNPSQQKEELAIVLQAYQADGNKEKEYIKPLCWLGKRGEKVGSGFFGSALFELPKTEEEFHKHAILIGAISLTEEIAKKLSEGASGTLEIAPIRRGNLLKLLKNFGSLAVKSEGE